METGFSLLLFVFFAIQRSMPQYHPTKPVITFNQPTGVYLFGEMGTITCTVTGDKIKKLFDFYRETIPVHNSPEYTLDNFYTFSLEANFLGGPYKCRYGVNDNGGFVTSPMSEPVNVIIADPLKIPVISLDQTTGVYAVGETITMTCKVTGDNRTKTFTFYKGHQQLPPTTNITSANTLRFSKTSANNSGQYQCRYRINFQDRHLDSNQSQAVTLTMADLPKPYISVDSSAVVLGGAVTFNCTSPGDNPDIAFYLYRQGDVNHCVANSAASGINSVTFTIWNVKHSEIGTYTCRYETLINGRNLSSILSDPVHITLTGNKAVSLAVGVGSAVALILLLALLGFCLWRNGKKKNNRQTRNTAPSRDQNNENLTYAVLNLQTKPKRDLKRQRDTGHAQSEDYTLYAAVKR